LALVAPAGVLWLHQWRFGTYLAYFNFNLRGMRLIKWPPFHKIGEEDGWPTMYLLIVFFTAVLALWNVAFPLAVFSSVYFLYCSVLNHTDIYRYALPGYSLALLIGLDMLWSHPQFKENAPLIGACYAIGVVPYIIINLATNRADDEWVISVMSRPISKG
jgi:hypothetical protein